MFGAPDTQEAVGEIRMEALAVASIGVVLVILLPTIWLGLRWIRANPDDTRREEMVQGKTLGQATDRSVSYGAGDSGGGDAGGGDGGGN